MKYFLIFFVWWLIRLIPLFIILQLFIKTDAAIAITIFFAAVLALREM